MNKNCLHCGVEFKAKKARQVYCSSEHRSFSIQDRQTALNEHRTWDIPPGTVGAIHELVASIDLMKNGYHVFRALSPSCQCDLLLLIGEKVLRVEVTTGTLHTNGTLYFPAKQKHRFDILAVVCGNKVTYFPSLSELVTIGL